MSKTLQQLIQDFLTSLIDPPDFQETATKAINELSTKWAARLQTATFDEKRAALEYGIMHLEDLKTEYNLAVLILNMVGSLVETSWGITPDTGCGNPKAHGLDAKFAAPLIVPWLENIMARAAVFYTKASDFKDEKEYTEECEKLFKKRDPDINAFMALQQLCPPLNVFFSRNPEGRKLIRSSSTIISNSIILRPTQPMLFSQVNILDDEEYLVLCPAEKKGFHLKISGVATTAQLQGILQSLLLGRGIPGNPMSKPQMAVMVGGYGVPQFYNEPMKLEFNMHHWIAWTKDGLDKQEHKRVWIMHIPAFISKSPVQFGTGCPRVILISPYTNSFPTGKKQPFNTPEGTVPCMRTFGSLSASATVIKRLDENDTMQYLDTLANIEQAKRDEADKLILTGSLIV